MDANGPPVHLVVLQAGAVTHRAPGHPLAAMAPGGTVQVASRPAELASWLVRPATANPVGRDAPPSERARRRAGTRRRGGHPRSRGLGRRRVPEEAQAPRRAGPHHGGDDPGRVRVPRPLRHRRALPLVPVRRSVRARLASHPARRPSGLRAHVRWSRETEWRASKVASRGIWTATRSTLSHTMDSTSTTSAPVGRSRAVTGPWRPPRPAASRRRAPRHAEARGRTPPIDRSVWSGTGGMTSKAKRLGAGP